MSVYYNEIDPYCCAWLRNLIAAGHLPAGDVDERSIADVQPDDLRGYNQAHFFAGIGGWPLALRLSLWPDTRPVWTGSCPCQPFSDAGQRKGIGDDRHLWPTWFALIRECQPAIVFGEQVARAVGFGWLDAVALDLEAEGYAFGAATLPACAVSAPHERSRVWFVAVADGQSKHALPFDAEVAEVSQPVADPSFQRRDRRWYSGQAGRCEPANGGHVAHTDIEQMGRIAEPRSECGFWSVEPDVGRVAHGVPARVAKLRAFGNAIVPQVAAEFIKATM